MKIKIKCKFCKKEVLVRARANNFTNRFCSKACRKKWDKEQQIKVKFGKKEILFDEIKSIKIEKCNEKFYDIETETKNFIANKLITHNCKKSKKSVACGCYLPDTLKEKISVWVAIDTSGSIGKEELSEFVTEIIGLARAYRERIDMRVITADAEVHTDYLVQNGNIDKIKKIKIKGGGGTAHKPVFDYITEKDRNAKCLIFFTDGYSDLESLDYNKYKFGKIAIINKNGTSEWVKGKERFVKVIKMKEYNY